MLPPDQPTSEDKESQNSQSTRHHAPARFVNQVAVVTGASDKGIGGAVAERLAEEGASLLLISRNEPIRLLKRLSRNGYPVLWTACDVSQQEAVDQAIQAGWQQFGRLDIVVNNAGLEIAQSIDQMPDTVWQQLLDVNLTGAMRVARAALPQLSRPGGVIVNVSSALALGGCPGFSAYSATKAGLIGWTQSLALELASIGIRVVGVAPALVHTPMIHKHIAHLTDKVRDQIAASHPLGMGTTHDVAAAVAFLASSEARWITGITLPLGFVFSYPLPTEQFMQGS